MLIFNFFKTRSAWEMSVETDLNDSSAIGGIRRSRNFEFFANFRSRSAGYERFPKVSRRKMQFCEDRQSFNSQSFRFTTTVYYSVFKFTLSLNTKIDAEFCFTTNHSSIEIHTVKIFPFMYMYKFSISPLLLCNNFFLK